jgi:hypothetical protein
LSHKSSIFGKKFFVKLHKILPEILCKLPIEMKYRSCGPNTSGSKQKREGQVSLPHLGLDFFEFEVGQGFPLVAVIVEDILSFKPLQQGDLTICEQEIKVFIILFVVDNNSLAALGLDGRLSVVSALVAGEDFFGGISRFHFDFLSFLSYK